MNDETKRTPEELFWQAFDMSCSRIAREQVSLGEEIRREEDDFLTKKIREFTENKPAEQGLIAESKDLIEVFHQNMNLLQESQVERGTHSLNQEFKGQKFDPPRPPSFPTPEV